MQVAPAELEDLLLAHPAIADCAVVPSPTNKPASQSPMSWRGPIDW
jgi:acyl-coenzyme A synthetase/AMP-(fatty) acid ligase